MANVDRRKRRPKCVGLRMPERAGRRGEGKEREREREMSHGETERDTCVTVCECVCVREIL